MYTLYSTTNVELCLHKIAENGAFLSILMSITCHIIVREKKVLPIHRKMPI